MYIEIKDIPSGQRINRVSFEIDLSDTGTVSTEKHVIKDSQNAYGMSKIPDFVQDLDNLTATQTKQEPQEQQVQQVQQVKQFLTSEDLDNREPKEIPPEMMEGASF